MTVPALAAVAGTSAVAAYLDAKFHIRHDLTQGSLDNARGAALTFISQREAENRLLVYHNIEHWAQLDRPNHLFLEFEGRSWTYKAFYEDLQRVGNWLINDLGIQKHEIVAIDGPNSPEYLMLWFALDGIGACPSFVNCNLTGDSLTHCVKVSKPASIWCTALRSVQALRLSLPNSRTIRRESCRAMRRSSGQCWYSCSVL